MFSIASTTSEKEPLNLFIVHVVFNNFCRLKMSRVAHHLGNPGRSEEPCVDVPTG